MAKAAFRQAELQRIIRAFTSEGLPPPRIEINRRTGDIIALPTAEAEPQGDDLDQLIRATMSDGDG